MRRDPGFQQAARLIFQAVGVVEIVVVPLADELASGFRNADVAQFAKASPARLDVADLGIAEADDVVAQRRGGSSQTITAPGSRSPAPESTRSRTGPVQGSARHHQAADQAVTGSYFPGSFYDDLSSAIAPR
jgi:hypothetical protein